MDNQSVMSTVIRWFGHPLVGVLGTVTSVVSIPLAFWFYYQAIPSRELAVLEPPVRSVFVNSDAPAALAVTIHGEAVTNQDVFATQFAIWNNGNQSIRPENVLEQVVFRPVGNVKVIEAKVIRHTRAVCELAAHVGSNGSEAGINWRILEAGDGAIVQVLMVGDENCKMEVTGTIEGGGTPRYVHLVSQADNKSQQTWGESKSLMSWLVDFFMFFAFAGLGIQCLVVGLPKSMQKRGTKRVESAFWAVVGGAVFLFLAWAMAAMMYHRTFHDYRVPAGLLAGTTTTEPPKP